VLLHPFATLALAWPQMNGNKLAWHFTFCCENV